MLKTREQRPGIFSSGNQECSEVLAYTREFRKLHGCPGQDAGLDETWVYLTFPTGWINSVQAGSEAWGRIINSVVKCFLKKRPNRESSAKTKKGFLSCSYLFVYIKILAFKEILVKILAEYKLQLQQSRTVNIGEGKIWFSKFPHYSIQMFNFQPKKKKITTCTRNIRVWLSQNKQ